MNLSFDDKKANTKFGYGTVKVGDLADLALHAKAQQYRRDMSAKTRSLSSQEISTLPKSKGYFASRKYDGEFAMVLFDGKNVISVNPGGTVRFGLPCFAEAEAILTKAKVKSAIFGAELYVKNTKSKANMVQQIVSILRSPKSKEQLQDVGLAIFDIIEIDGGKIDTTAAIFNRLKELFGKGDLSHNVEFKQADSLDDILARFTDWVIGEEAEGVVLRHDQAGWFKIKLKHNIDVAIIGFSEGQDNRKGMIHDLLVAIVRNDGTFQELTRVGGGFSDEERRMFVEELRKRIVPSDYVAVNNDYVAYEMVKPETVIEISCLDLVAEKTRGGPVNRMVLEFDGKRFNALSRMPLVSVISPQFIGIRDDKTATSEDVNISQISDLVAVPDAAKAAQGDELKPSEVLLRTVYTKVMAGNTMVRKLLLWKTNKDEADGFPQFVVYLTDFSPNRKNPLERTIKIAATKRKAERMFDDLAKKNFIGGWEKVV